LLLSGGMQNRQMFHQGRSRFKALRIMASSFPPTELNCTPIPLPGLELRTTASSFSSPSTMAKISLSGVPTATTSFVTMNAPEALKSNTREVYLCFSNLHDTHMPVGVGTRRSFLLSGPASGFDPRSGLSARTFNKSPDYRRTRFYSIISVIGGRLNPNVLNLNFQLWPRRFPTALAARRWFSPFGKNFVTERRISDPSAQSLFLIGVLSAPRCPLRLAAAFTSWPWADFAHQCAGIRMLTSPDLSLV